MGKTPQQLGREFERGVIIALARHGVTAWRPLQHHMSSDLGDLHAGPFALQCKQYANTATAINKGVQGAREQAQRAGKTYGAAVVRHRGYPVSESRVVMHLEDFARLMLRLEVLEKIAAGVDGGEGGV